MFTGAEVLIMWRLVDDLEYKLKGEKNFFFSFIVSGKVSTGKVGSK